jgi:hypothetical protein
MTSQRLGLLIGSVFGLVFVQVNAGALTTGIGTACRVVGGFAFLLVLARLRRVQRPSRSVPRPQAGISFTAGYRVVVAAEVIAIVVGVRLLAGPLDVPDAGVAWVAFVVGLHFVALAIVWAVPIFGWVGGLLAVCGVAGLLLGFSEAPKAAIAGVGGVLPGGLLLGFALWAVHRPSNPAPAGSGRGDAVGVPE